MVCHMYMPASLLLWFVHHCLGVVFKASLFEPMFV